MIEITTKLGDITYYWTPGSYASGGTADYNNGVTTQEVAWYNANSGSKTQDVVDRPLSVKGLGLLDIKGNI